jgi:AcrR family transcriptional regulator
MRERGLTEGGRERHAARRAERVPAAERRRLILDAALRVFAAGSYAGATTAQIAREAEVSEPILYRHFASKRELYFACLEEAWRRLEEASREEEAHHAGGQPLAHFGKLVKRTLPLRVATANLWMQAITEAGGDPEIRRFVRGHMRAVHDFHADALRRAQEAGVVAADRDPEVEAWIFLAGTLLFSLADRLGGLLGERELEAIRAQRVRWLAGGD